jgi:hypothetical protein
LIYYNYLYFFGVTLMTYYYVMLQSKSHAFILERRMKLQGVDCDLVYLPREIMKELCNMGVRFNEYNFFRAIDLIKQSGLPDCRVYAEIVHPDTVQYVELQL